MPVAKLRTNSLDALKPMADNSVNTYYRQAVGNESLLSFSRTGDTPVQWYQFLHALEPQDWPFMTPVKVPMHKCDKCSKEFCSPINYRRHIRVHRRSVRADKEWHKNRDLLAAFWDKLSLETVKEIVSFDDVTLEEVPGPSIIWSLASFVRKPGFGVFPLQYVKAGSALLDIIQSRPARLPISSQELFAILDDASEGTFLCAGTAESMQKFVFDGEAGKKGMEQKNLVACTSFLVEQKLVRYWVADMDAVSLRCQQLLVEEEEAAQRRQAKLLERRRQKKLRQKEHKAKEQVNGETAELEDDAVLTPDRPSSSETTNLSVSSESSSNFIDATVDHPFSFPLSVESSTFIQEHIDVEPLSGFTSETSETGPYPNIENQRAYRSERKQSGPPRWQVQKPQRTRNGFHSGLEPQISKVESMQRHGTPRDQKSTQSGNGHKVWTRKPKPERDNGERYNTQVEKASPNYEPKAVHDNGMRSDTQVKKASANRKPKPFHDNGVSYSAEFEKAETTPNPKLVHESEKSNSTQVEKATPVQSNEADQNCELMIGSISVTLERSNILQQSEVPVSDDSCQEKHRETNGGLSRSKVKLWRPVSRNGNMGRSGDGESAEGIVRESHEKAVLSDTCHSDGKAAECWINPLEGSNEQERFSPEAARAFLSQRWKEATAGEYVTLVLTPEAEVLDCEDAENDYQVTKTLSDSQSRAILGNAEENVVVLEPSTNRGVKGKFKPNPEKGGVKTKYIPKNKTATKGK